MNLNNKQIKRMLSISFDDFLQNKIGSFQTIKWEDTYIKGRDPHPYPRCLKKKNKEPVTGMILLDDKDRCIESKHMRFKGIKLGPETFTNTYKTILIKRKHGLTINLNWRAYREGAVDKLVGANPRIPENIELNYFGGRLALWHPKRHASKFSIKFYDEFIKKSLTQDNLIKEIEKNIGRYKHVNYGFEREIVHILKSINNFETFLNDEMNLLQEDFKDYKKIKTISDCANILFIFNPLFKEVMEFEFQNHYIEHNADEYRERYETEIDKIKKQRREIKKQFEEQIKQTKFDF